MCQQSNFNWIGLHFGWESEKFCVILTFLFTCMNSLYMQTCVYLCFDRCKYWYFNHTSLCTNQMLFKCVVSNKMFTLYAHCNMLKKLAAQLNDKHASNKINNDVTFILFVCATLVQSGNLHCLYYWGCIKPKCHLKMLLLFKNLH